MLHSCSEIKRIAVVSAVVVFFILDRILKLAALAARQKINLLGEYFTFEFSANKYIALSLPVPDGPLIRAVIALIIAAISVLLLRYYKNKNSLGQAGCWLLLSGAVSNLADRIIYSYVIDYFQIRYFTIFNLADASIVIGAGLLIWDIYRKRVI